MSEATSRIELTDEMRAALLAAASAAQTAALDLTECMRIGEIKPATRTAPQVLALATWYA